MDHPKVFHVEAFEAQGYKHRTEVEEFDGEQVDQESDDAEDSPKCNFHVHAVFQLHEHFDKHLEEFEAYIMLETGRDRSMGSELIVPVREKRRECGHLRKWHHG